MWTRSPRESQGYLFYGLFAALPPTIHPIQPKHPPGATQDMLRGKAL